MNLSLYVDSIQPKDKLNYLILLTVSVWFFTSVYKAEISFLIALLIAIVVITYDQDVIKQENGSLNSDLENKLNSLLQQEHKPPPKHFHTEPDFINFFYSIADFRIYNRDAYVRAINTADTLLSIKLSLENDFRYYPEYEMTSWQNFTLQEIATKDPKQKSNIKNHRQLFELAETTGIKSLNYIHCFIVNLPATKFYRKKHEKAVKRYNILIFRILDDILHHSHEFSDNPELIGIDYGKQKPYQEENELNSSFNYFY